MLNTISTTDTGRFGLIPVTLIIAAVTSMVVGYLLFSPNDLQSGEFQGARLGHFRPHPEYNRQLRGVVVTLAMRDSSLELQDETLIAMPDYTRIFLLLTEDNQELLQSELKDKTYRDQVELIP